MAEKAIIIIGAGIAGLSAGCYGQMNGYKTKIFELHNLPGGPCTSWKRKGYTIDGCIHWLTGSSPANSFYRMWEEVGAIQGRTIVDHDVFIRIEGKDNKELVFYSNLDRLEQHLKELAPEDSNVIDEFIDGARRCTRIDMPVDKAPEVMGPIDKLKMMPKMMPFIRLMRKWGKVSLQDFAQRFGNQFLREAFPVTIDMPDFPMAGLLMTCALLHNRAGGYPIGGSLEFARAIEQRYVGLGGETHYKSPVTRILVENDRAVGVRLADGSEHRSDVIISAADGRTTIFDMLEGKYVDAKIQGYYNSLPIFPPYIWVALGVARSFDEMPSTVAGESFLLDVPITVAGKEWRRMPVHIYNYDPSLAPKGKTLVISGFLSDYGYWKEIKQESERYKAEKERIADLAVAELNKRFPGLTDQVEMRDVATPMTFERYTGNWQGTFEGWLLTTKTPGMRMKKTLPGLANFYMAGHWVEPGGGLPTAIMSGRNAVQIICKKDKKKFVTATA